MWIALNDGFVSIVKHRDKPGVLLVRARRKGDIENVFPGARTWEDAKADYRYRAEIYALDVAQTIFTRITGIDYDNFKNSVGSRELHDAYLSVWSVMYGVQNPNVFSRSGFFDD